MQLSHKITFDGNDVYVKLVGNITLIKARKFKEVILEFIDQGKFNVHIDLSSVDLIDSMAISALIALLKRTHEYGGQLYLNNPNRFVLQVFKITRLNEVFTIQ
ncbi:anti-sigma factor antagonist [Heliobacillus mobilis]|uniref:Anti-sigma factor antagonist n=1 Tax=Heliobacterium mobile TaxID=28064 RepID=A0A6I3SH37_HELMO|nr:anti-sigma factor antagonist [Heliobacterium mobile]